MAARFRDGGDNRRALDRLQTLQFFVEGVVALGGHRHFFHCGVLAQIRPMKDLPGRGRCRPGVERIVAAKLDIKSTAQSSRDRQP